MNIIEQSIFIIEKKTQRQRWVTALRNGENPFTAEGLATLR
jgi:hypothetical protein